MSDIVLSSGVRSNLLQLQQTSDLITSTQTKLATGKRVNSALDNPNNYFTAQGLDSRAGDLNNLLDSMATAINTIQAANNGISAITKLVQSAQSLASQAQQTSDTTVRASLSTQFDAIRTQIDQLAKDSGFNGINLLSGASTDNLTVVLNEKSAASGNQSSVTVNSTDTTSTGLGVAAAANAWADATDITAASTTLTAALTTLRSQSQTLSSSLSTVQIRQDFTTSTINTLQTGSSDLTLADSNQEGANLLALQTRQQLSTTALSLASQADQNVLKLFQ
ncbi:MAG TPA: flagellin [Pseudolabrys sp.]|jgi:flagellin